MAKDPAFLFYTSDFLMGTMVMSLEDRGKYITLLSYMHQAGRLSEQHIRTLIGDISDNLKVKFKMDRKGLWYNVRLEEEVAKRKAFVNSRRSNGRLGGRPCRAKINVENHKPVINEEEKYSFGKFWKIYGKPTEKQSCLLKWNKLAETDKELIFLRLPAYIEATPERQFRKNPLTYLNRKIWLDELLPEPPVESRKSAFEKLAETGKYE